MQNQIKDFIQIFNPLFKRGLPLFWEQKGGMLSQKEYNDRLINCRLYHRQFDDMQQQSLSGKTVIGKLAGDFEMLFDFKATCDKFPYFSHLKNVELRVLDMDMNSLYFPTADQWNTIENYGKRKHKLH